MGAPWITRNARAGQAGALANLHAACFADARHPDIWGHDVIAGLLAAPGGIAVTLHPAGVAAPGPACGFALGQFVAAALEIWSLAVLPSWRRRGGAQALLARLSTLAADAGARRLLLEVHAENIGALRLYAGQGFGIDGIRRGYYPAGASDGPADAILMSRTLRPAPGHNDQTR